MEHKYYILKPAVGTKETGMAYPAVESYDDYDFSAPNSVHKIKYHEFPDFVPDIRFKLAKGAMLCDMMGQATISGHGFLISENLMKVFEKVKLVKHKYYNATIENKDILHKYFWVHFVWLEANDVIDYINSNFYIKKFSSILEEIKLKSYNEFKIEKEKIGTLKTIDFSKLIIKSITFDMFLVPFRGEIYINEYFKSLLDEFNITGIDTQKTDKLFTVPNSNH